MSNKPDNEATTRREFLRNAAATAAVTAAASGVAKSSVYSLAPARVLGANDRIHIGHIGVGTQGFNAHVKLLDQNKEPNNTQAVAISDLYGRRMREVGDFLHLSESVRYWDYRKLLDSKDIDAVVIATSDNWHARCAVDALEAGKHVYCEKPMCKTLAEAFKVYDTVKKTGRKFQLGVQASSNPKYYHLQKIVKDGKIGHVVVGQDSYNRNSKEGEWNNYGRFDKDAGPNASGDARVDWDTFRKGTEPKEWDPDRYFRWRKYWEYGSGVVGDLFPHRLFPLVIAMGIPTTGHDGFPKRVMSGGGLYVQKINPETHKIDREVPDFNFICVDYGDYSLMAMSSTITEEGWPPMIRGNKATLLYSGNTGVIKPERVWADEIDGSSEPLEDNGDQIEVHHKNWLDSIRHNGTPNAHADLAIRVQVMITLGELAYRNSQTFTFDPKTRTAKPATTSFPPA